MEPYYYTEFYRNKYGKHTGNMYRPRWINDWEGTYLNKDNCCYTGDSRFEQLFRSEIFLLKSKCMKNDRQNFLVVQIETIQIESVQIEDI